MGGVVRPRAEDDLKSRFMRRLTSLLLSTILLVPRTMGKRNLFGTMQKPRPIFALTASALISRRPSLRTLLRSNGSMTAKIMARSGL